MAPPLVPDGEFITLFEKYGPRETARRIGIAVRNVYGRRDRIEKKEGISLVSPDPRTTRVKPAPHPQRVCFEVKDGVVLVGSDAHYWPGEPSTAHRAFVKFVKELTPAAVVFNGDAIDGARISRHAPIGWERRPTLVEEIEATKERLQEIVLASKRSARKVWLLGNHDARFETRLAMVAPEYANLHGVHLKDHFPSWTPGWAAWINDSVIIKHRFRGGMHATQNNTLWAGKTMITGHLHSLRVTPLTDYNGIRWGVDAGCLADIYAPAFTDYTEDSPRNWRSGFVVLTFVKGQLLWPEIVYVIDERHVGFRGRIVAV